MKKKKNNEKQKKLVMGVVIGAIVLLLLVVSILIIVLTKKEVYSRTVITKDNIKQEEKFEFRNGKFKFVAKDENNKITSEFSGTYELKDNVYYLEYTFANEKYNDKVYLVDGKLCLTKTDCSNAFTTTGNVKINTSSPADNKNLANNADNVVINVIYWKSCGVCTKLHEYLDEEIKPKYNDKVTINYFEVNDPEYEGLYEKFTAFFEEDSNSVPVYAINDKFYLGFSESFKTQIENNIEEDYENKKFIDVIKYINN